MMDSVYWIWFQLVFGVGTRRSQLMLDFFQHPAALFESASTGGKAADMMEKAELARFKDMVERAEKLRQRTLSKGCTIVTPDDKIYPQGLHNIHAKPAVLYVKGDISCLEDTLSIAMVGSRECTEYGSKVASMLAAGLAANGVVIVSGLANGIDSVSHTAALNACGKTIGVLACGIDVDYPKESRQLKSRMKDNGAVVTEYPLKTQPLRHHFPVRNRLLSGMSHGVVVVEGGERSGTLLTAHHALDQDRDVFAVPGSIFSLRQRGPHMLIKDGAKPVESVEDILVEYPQFIKLPLETNTHTESLPFMEQEEPFQPETCVEQVQPKDLPESVSDAAREVFGYMGAGSVTVDQLAGLSTLSTGELLSALTELEIYGMVQGHPGRRFTLLNSQQA